MPRQAPLSPEADAFETNVAALLHAQAYKEAFELIISTLGPGGRGFLRAKTGSELHGDSLYDELRDSLWDHLPDLAQRVGKTGAEHDRPLSVRAWFFRNARNRFLHWRERRSRDNLPLPSYADQLVRNLAPGPSSIARYSELLELITKELTEAELDVFVLRTERDLSFPEIGEVLGITDVAARMRFQQTRKRIKDLLARIQQS